MAMTTKGNYETARTELSEPFSGFRCRARRSSETFDALRTMGSLKPKATISDMCANLRQQLRRPVQRIIDRQVGRGRYIQAPPAEEKIHEGNA